MTETAKAGASLYFVGADVEKAIDELRRTNAVRLRTSGSSQPTQALVDAAYAKIMDLIKLRTDESSTVHRES